MKLHRERIWVACITGVVLWNMQLFRSVEPQHPVPCHHALTDTTPPVPGSVEPIPISGTLTVDEANQTQEQDHPRACAPGYAQLPVDWGEITKGLTKRATPRKIIHFTVFDCEVRLIFLLLFW